MSSYNKNFDLTVEDMDLIEDALREVTTKLSSEAVSAKDSAAPAIEKARHINDLLGRLHNQKIFYRPQNGAYIGG